MTLEQMVALVGIGSAVVGGLGWLFKLQGRLGSHEAECAQFRARIDERHETSTKQAHEQHREIMDAIKELQKNQFGFVHQRATDR